MPPEMTDKDWELLSQYVDGELADVDRRRLERRLAGDQALSAELHAMRELNSSLTRAMGRRSDVPAAVASAVAGLGESDEIAERREGDSAPSPGATVLPFPQKQPAPARSPGSRWPLAAAASVLAALGLTLMLSGNNQQGSLPGNDRTVAAALDTLSSGDDWKTLADGRELRPVLTFAHRDGQWCREYLLRDQARDVRAVACREDGSWVTQAAGYESYLDSTSAYRPAGASDSAPVSVFISENAAGIALGRDQESALIADEWRQEGP
jgi:hypothetical protein